jgi:hypothetical protein
MRFLTKLLRRHEARQLRAKIVAARPDLIGHPLEYQIDRYVPIAIKAYIQQKAEYNDIKNVGTGLPVPQLPNLVERALSYRSCESKGYYHAQYLLCLFEKMDLVDENADYAIKNHDLTIENIEAHALARDAVAFVTKGRDPEYRQN